MCIWLADHGGSGFQFESITVTVVLVQFESITHTGSECRKLFKKQRVVPPDMPFF